jgi:hypothetical protein
MTVRHLAVAAALVTLALAPAARAGAPDRERTPPPAAAEPPPGSERTELHLRFPAWRPVGTFRLVGAAGTVSDTGVAREEGDAVAGVTERVLEGEHGTLVLRLRTASKIPIFPPLFGRWEVVRGTGAYSRLAGGGTYTMCGSGTASKGSPFEVQTLVGHVVAAR